KLSKPRLRLRLTAAAERQIRSGHPWVFATSVRDQNRPGHAGELAIIYDQSNSFLGLGLFDPSSPVRVRILHCGKPVEIDDAWWTRRLVQPLKIRCGLATADTTGYRCLHGENDGWPGLVLDRYSTTFVLKLYTSAWLPHLPTVMRSIGHQLKPDRLVLRLSRNVQSFAQS